jgi:arylsulfatase A-like enzyme/Flp pilus assembly protein TadD
VLLVSWDTVRADHVGEAAAPGRAYADPRWVAPRAPGATSPTPRLDALARAGVAFLEARSPVAITLPAHASLLTGWLPHQHGARDNGQFRVADSAATLAEHFADAGYATGAFVSSAVLAADFGLARGFERYDDALTVKTGNRSLASRRADQTVAAALEWLAALPAERPCFLWLHLFAPHRPWRAPEPFASRFDPYRAEIAFADAQTGRLLDALDAAGRLKRAIVVVTSDHGEGLGEHGEGTHSYFAYDSTLRVPLVFWAGAAAPPGLARGLRVEGPAALVDVAPTLARWAGVAEPSGAGRSLLPALAGEAPVPPRELPLESVVPALDYAAAPVFGLLDAQGRVWFDGPRRELFELAEDPAQLRNRYRPGDAARADALFARVERAWPPETALLPVDAETRARLEALGYASDAEAPAADSGIDAKDRVELFDFKSLGAESLSLEQTLARIDALRAEHGPVLALEHFRADTLAALGQGEAALAALEQAAREHPQATALRARVEAQRAERDRKQQLAAAIRAALERDPDHPTAQRDLALTLHQLERWDEARDLYRAWLTRHPDDDAARANLSRLLAASGAPEAALATLTDRRSQPGHASELDCLAGRLLLEAGREREALEPLRACDTAGGNLPASGRALLDGHAASVPAAPAP